MRRHQRTKAILFRHVLKIESQESGRIFRGGKPVCYSRSGQRPGSPTETTEWGAIWDRDRLEVNPTLALCGKQWSGMGWGGMRGYRAKESPTTPCISSSENAGGTD